MKNMEVEDRDIKGTKNKKKNYTTASPTEIPSFLNPPHGFTTLFQLSK